MSLLVFFLLMVKHFIGDFALQGRLKLTHDKHLLTSKKGHSHALDHAIGTALVFLFVSSYAYAHGKVIFITILLFPLLDYVLHFFIDWCKANFVIANQMKQQDREFWILTAFDQIFHTSAYLLIVVLFDIYFF
jgi:uncharacterized membrane protein YgdD (TMEM256/DUF423 family)